MDIKKYLDYCYDNRVPPHFTGVRPFYELVKMGRITPFITTIRIMYSGLIDQHYCLNDDGMLLSINYPENPPQKPEEILHEYEYSRGWEIEGMKPKHMCE